MQLNTRLERSLRGKGLWLGEKEGRSFWSLPQRRESFGFAKGDDNMASFGFLVLVFYLQLISNQVQRLSNI